MDQNTGSMSSDAKTPIEAGLRVLDKQRVQLLKMMADDQSNNERGVTSWAKKAMVAVDARQQALAVFVGMDDAVLHSYAEILENLLVPLELPEADEHTFAAYLAQKAPGTDDPVDQADDNIQDRAQAIPTEQSPGVALEETEPTAELEERIVQADNGAEQPDGSDHIHAEAAPVGEDQGTAIEGSGATNNDSITSPSSRKNRPPKQQGTWSSDYAGVEFLTISPTIIKLKDGTFIELRCDICQGNSSWAHQTMNKGVRGLQSHLRQVHDDKAGVASVLQRCTHRVVSAQEVERISSGDSKIDLVPCKSKVSVGSGVEYVGQSTVGGEVSTHRAGHTVESLAAAAIAAANSIGGPPGPSTPKKQSRTRNVSAPSLANCLVVVKAADANGAEKYHELRCDVCHGNGSFGSGKLLEGIKGFKAHFRQIHKEHLSTAEILRRCSHREVPMQEVQAIQRGQVNIGFIRCGVRRR